MENATERMTVNNEKLERDPVKTVILASMMGTAIEFFDFYAYGTASAAYFPKDSRAVQPHGEGRFREDLRRRRLGGLL